MAGNRDWMPKKIKYFDDFQEHFCAEVNENKIAWNISAEKCEILLEKQAVYGGYYLITKLKVRSNPKDYVNTRVARMDLKAYIRRITREEIKNNSNILNIERKDIGVPNEAREKVKSRVSIVAPGVKYRSVDTLIGFYGFTPRKKPKGQGSYQIKTGFYRLGKAIPKEKDCTQFDNISRASQPILYDAENFGMLFVSYTRYLSTRSKVGRGVTRYLGVVS